MAIDYGIQVPQVQPVQQPNMLQQIMLINQIREVQQATQARNAMRAALSDPNFDPTSPEGMRTLFHAGGTNAGPIIASAATAGREIRQGKAFEDQSKLTLVERKLKATELFRARLPAVEASPNPREAYRRLQEEFTAEFGPNGNPTEYPGPEGARKLMMSAEKFVESVKNEYRDVGGVPRRVLPNGDLQTPNILPPNPLGPVPAPGGPQVDATGVPSYPVNPTRMAQMRQAGQTYAPELVAPRAMPGAAPTLPAGLSPPANALAPPSPPANAMTRSTNAEDVLQAQKDQEAARAAALDAQKKDQERAAKKVEAMPVVQSSARAAIDALDMQLRDIDELLGRSGRSMVTGPIFGRSFVPSSIIPGDPLGGAGAQAVIDKIKSQSGLTALQELRKNSPTGGALGNVSNQEGLRLENSAAALAQTQSTTDFDKQLKKYRSDLELAKQRIAEAYKREYGGDLPAELQTNRVGGAGAVRKDDLTVVAPNGAEYKFNDKAAADKFFTSISKGQ